MITQRRAGALAAWSARCLGGPTHYGPVANLAAGRCDSCATVWRRLSPGLFGMRLSAWKSIVFGHTMSGQ